MHHGERCRSARRAVVHYRALTWERQEARGGELADRTPIARGKTCRWARYAAGVHRARAQSARRALRHWRRWVETSEGAIRFAFGPYAEQALAVARCESGHSMTPRAHNGQYLGIFQMGESERATYGHGDTPLEQALAAFAYFVASGRDWSPWSCKP